MFRYLSLFWYYPSFLFCLYVYIIKLQKKEKRQIIIDQIFSNLKIITKSFLDKFNKD